eukprot:TRINITY_DN14395_c0_g5_i3.p1 TRINITY_DN14395_c0_g5~~TRINITY_DN14395_c0_g5_i3.p1  ORF type:complete len:534 (-),score=77.25 TRINITY_DN14395_c0_g5_i3:177-1724(-)
MEAARDDALSRLEALERELCDTSKDWLIPEIKRFRLRVQKELARPLEDENEAIKGGGTASLLGSAINLAKTCVGTGILSLPYAFRGCGLLWGTLFTIFCGAMAAFTLFLLGEVALVGGRKPTLHAVGFALAGNFGSVLVDISVCANNLGAMISYLVIASTTVENIVRSNFRMAGWPRQIYVMLGLMIIAPLCFVSKVNMLRYSSSVAMAALALVTLMIVLFSLPWDDGSPFDPCGGDVACQGTVSLWTSPLSVLTQFVIFTNAYTCQHAMLPIVAELKRPTRRRKCIVIFGAMGAVCLLLLTVGVAGYLTFGSAVESNVLFSYPTNSMFVVLALVGMIIDVLSSYPLLMFMTRLSVCNLLRNALCWLGCPYIEWLDNEEVPHPTTSNGALAPDSEEAPLVVSPLYLRDFIGNRFELICTLLIMSFTLGVALVVTDLGMVAALTGATGATMIGYVVPGFLYVKQFCRGGCSLQQRLRETAEPFFAHKITIFGAAAILSLGIVLVPVGSFLTLTKRA